MTNPLTNPVEPRSAQRARRRLLMTVTAVMLVGAAAVVLVLPLRLPLFVRLAVAFTDLTAASALWLAIRQKSAGPPH